MKHNACLCLHELFFEHYTCLVSIQACGAQEIKEVAEKRRHSDDGQGMLTLSVAAPYVTRVAAELTYDYKDRYCPQPVS